MLKMIVQYWRASLDFGRFNFAAENGEVHKSPLSMGTVPDKQKSLLQRNRLFRRPNSVQTQRAFFRPKMPFANTDGVTSQTVQVERPQERVQAATAGES